jgi:hypothetical protein
MAMVAAGHPEPLDARETPVLPVPDTVDRSPAPAPVVEPAPAPPASPSAASAAPAGLSIAAHGVGTGVVDHKLVGEAAHFPEGTQVSFWTQVEGGAAGETIRHVWLHHGQEVLTMPLPIGGTRWRTQSVKTLHPGSSGNWAVEARDAAGRVLARREFRCTPRPRR